VLTYLLRTSPNIKSAEFKSVLRIMLELLMINWGLPVNADAIIAQTEQTKTELICLTHGIEITSRRDPRDETTWVFSFHGAQYDHAGMLELTRHDRANYFNGRKAIDMCAHFDESKVRFNDIRYLVHRMQKPAFEMPNPVILSTFLRAGSQGMSVSAEGGTAHDKENRHSFHAQFLAYFKEEAGSQFALQAHDMRLLIESMFAVYDQHANHMWTVSSTMPAATYMQNNATELPSCAYHGNLFIDKLKGVREDIRCVGHLGNSFPGCSTIRQGKGMLNMYERMPLPIHVM
jgi:hypothetical protein